LTTKNLEEKNNLLEHAKRNMILFTEEVLREHIRAKRTVFQ